MTSPRTALRTTASLTAGLPALSRLAAAIPAEQPARMEIGNTVRENIIRVQLVACDDPQVGADVAAQIGLNRIPEQRVVSDKVTEYTWAGEIDGWVVIMTSRTYSTALNV